MPICREWGVTDILNANSESNISSANNNKISKPKISTENKHHRANSLLLAKENNKYIETKIRKKPKLKNSVIKKDPNSGRFYTVIKNVPP